MGDRGESCIYVSPWPILDIKIGVFLGNMQIRKAWLFYIKVEVKFHPYDVSLTRLVFVEDLGFFFCFFSFFPYSSASLFLTNWKWELYTVVESEKCLTFPVSRTTKKTFKKLSFIPVCFRFSTKNCILMWKVNFEPNKTFIFIWQESKVRIKCSIL